MRVGTAIIVSLVVAACSKPASAPAPASPAARPAAVACAKGELLGEAGCVKECASDEDCGPGGVCEELHVANDDGSIGPVQGRGCSAK